MNSTPLMPERIGGVLSARAWTHRPGVTQAIAMLAAGVILAGSSVLVDAQAPLIPTAAALSAAGEELDAAPVTLPAPNVAAPPPDSVAPPVEVVIPELKVRSRLVGLRVVAGELQAPVQFERAGWWSGGPAPGEAGAAVIVGHVDSRRGPAVFAKVSTLKPGAPVRVRRADGSVATFKVYAVRRYPKAALPSQEVYEGARASELRLITCGGRFNRRTGHYEDNVVVFAALDGPTPQAPKAKPPAPPAKPKAPQAKPPKPAPAPPRPAPARG